MQFYYGQQMPLRILDEAEFWKQQEEEHTVVIRIAIPNLEPQYVNTLKEWEKAFSETHQRTVSFIESVIRSHHVVSPHLYHEIMGLISYCMEQSLRFIEFLRQMIHGSQAVRSNPTAQTVLDHIIRESEYFVGITRTILYSKH